MATHSSILIWGIPWTEEPGSERITGRKSRDLQMEKIGCKCQTFFLSLLSDRGKQTTTVRFFFLFSI